MTFGVSRRNSFRDNAPVEFILLHEALAAPAERGLSAFRSRSLKECRVFLKALQIANAINRLLGRRRMKMRTQVRRVA